MEKAQMVVGFIRGSHGVKGECKMESASGEYEHLLKLESKEVTLQHGDEKKEIKVESISLGSNTMYVKFVGIDTPEAIQKYNKWEVVVPRKYCKPLKKDEWYIEDLRNCSLIYKPEQKSNKQNIGLEESGIDNDKKKKRDSASLNAPKVSDYEIIGTITDVLEGGAGYLLEVSLSESCGCISEELKYDANKNIRKVFIPFRNEFIGDVDVKKGTVQLMHLWILE